jgi:hypothetical protein
VIGQKRGLPADDRAIRHGWILDVQPLRRWLFSDAIRRPSPIPARSTVPAGLELTLDDDGIAAGSRLGRMRPRSLGARSGIRWRIFHGRSNYPDLLPSSLSGATCPIGECPVLWFGSRRGTGRLPAITLLPPRDGTGKPCVERNCNDGGARYASYRGKDSWMKPRSPNLPIASVSGHDTCYGCFSVIRARLRAKSPRHGVCRLRND